MRENGFAVSPPPSVSQQLASLSSPPADLSSTEVRDLRQLLWSSIDNDTSRDLDQLEVAEALPGDTIKVMVAVADVDASVPQDSPIDRFAAEQTTTVYLGVRTFSMLPETLSTGATSLLEGADRLAIVVEFQVASSGELHSSAVYRALVHNRAQLAYDSVGPWLERKTAPPAKVQHEPNLQAQLEIQNRAAAALRAARHQHGALNIETVESRPVVRDQQVVRLETEEKNAATALIEDFMIASNEIVARLLEDRHRAFIERIVRTPKRWDRIVAIANGFGDRLPSNPDSKALNEFLMSRAAKDPDHFPDLSLAVIKLMGPGEYVVSHPGDHEVGHFGLAVDDYTHSTAPNRRFVDLVTQRLVKAALADRPSPYSDEALSTLAAHCTAQANAVRKVEREMSKHIAAVAMASRVGDRFEAVVTGVNAYGTFVRIVRPHVEGMLLNGKGLDVGDKLTVTLVRTDAERGFIDFERR